MAEIVEIRSLEELTPYRMAWNALWQRTPGASFFQTYEWLENYWKHFGEDQRLRVLVVMSCGEPIGIVPLCERTEQYRLGPVRVLTYPLDHWGTWFGPVGPNVAAAMLMAMRHLHETPGNWDLLELRWTNAGRSDRGRTQRAMRSVGFRPQKAEFQLASAIDMCGTWHEYWSGRPSKWRSNMLRACRQVDACGDVQYLRHRPASAAEGDGDPAWHLYDACVDVAAHSWQGRESNGTTLSSPRVEAFLRDAHAAAARLGLVDMNVLTVGDRPVAFAYNYHRNGHVQGLRSGFDAQEAPTGAGSVLLYRTIEDSFARGDAHYDLGVGYHGYKAGFRTHAETSYRFTHYRTALRAQGIQLSRWVRRRLKSETPTLSKAG